MKILYVTTIGMTMCFFEPLIRELLQKGHCVDIACNTAIAPAPESYDALGCRIYKIDCSRSPFAPENRTAVKQIHDLAEENQYDIVHCHTPIAAVCTRIACIGVRKRGTRVFYTAHGFHFFKGAPLANWLLFYPLEKICSYFTDVLITINREDYALAKKKMKAGKVVYVPGVGVDLEKIRRITVEKAEKRRQLGIPETAVLLLSVGELNLNKNHQVIIKALAQLRNPNIHYAVAGMGSQMEPLWDLARALKIEKQVHLLGYRRDVGELCLAADIFCQPSHREGLGLAALEAMACGLPLITSNIHGIKDYSQNGVSGYLCAPNDVRGFAQAVQSLAASPEDRRRMGRNNLQTVKKYDLAQIIPAMMDIYGIRDLSFQGGEAGHVPV